MNHTLWIDADSITAIDPSMLTNGTMLPIKNTSLDFNEAGLIGKNLNGSHPQMKLANGIDHNYVLNQHDFNLPVAFLASYPKGRKITFYTNQPGIQLYTGNSLNILGKNNIQYVPYSGVCLETQGFPNAANTPEFPSVLLNEGEEYYSYTKLVCENIRSRIE